MSRPRIVVLCGPTRFGDAFREANLRETLAGRIVLTIGCDLHADGDLWPDPVERERVKADLDELHRRKIDLADEVLVLNVGGYIGTSTRAEIRYAVARGKPIRYLEPPDPGRAAIERARAELAEQIHRVNERLDAFEELLQQHRQRPRIEAGGIGFQAERADQPAYGDDSPGTVRA